MPVAFLLSLLPALAASPQSSTISLYLSVEEGDKLIGGLTEKNFRLYEDGRPVAFRLERPETPMLVTLLVERSRSSWFYPNDLDGVVQAFLDAAPEGHWYSLVTFSHGLEVAVDFTRQIGELRAAYSGLAAPMWQDIDTYDAIYDTLEKLELLGGRRVRIFIGSGLDTLSGRTLGDVEHKIESVNVTVFAAGAGSSLRGIYEPNLATTARMDLVQAEAFLNMLARKSGGQAWFPKFETAYRDVARAVFTTLENQYRLVKETSLPRDRKFHRLRVEAFQIADDKPRDFRVRVPEGWRRGSARSARREREVGYADFIVAGYVKAEPAFGVVAPRLARHLRQRDPILRLAHAMNDQGGRHLDLNRAVLPVAQAVRHARAFVAATVAHHGVVERPAVQLEQVVVALVGVIDHPAQPPALTQHGREDDPPVELGDLRQHEVAAATEEPARFFHPTGSQQRDASGRRRPGLGSPFQRRQFDPDSSRLPGHDLHGLGRLRVIGRPGNQ